MKILVTGFEPFGGAVINPAYEAVKLLHDVIAGAEVIKIESRPCLERMRKWSGLQWRNIIRMQFYVSDRLVEDPGSQWKRSQSI